MLTPRVRERYTLMLPEVFCSFYLYRHARHPLSLCSSGGVSAVVCFVLSCFDLSCAESASFGVPRLAVISTGRGQAGIRLFVHPLICAR
jgi:hypothetical protein